MKVHRHIGMCARHSARMRRMAKYARSDEEREELEQRADFWMRKQDALVTVLDISRRVARND